MKRMSLFYLWILFWTMAPIGGQHYGPRIIVSPPFRILLVILLVISNLSTIRSHATSNVKLWSIYRSRNICITYRRIVNCTIRITVFQTIVDRLNNFTKQLLRCFILPCWNCIENTYWHYIILYHVCRPNTAYSGVNPVRRGGGRDVSP